LLWPRLEIDVKHGVCNRPAWFEASQINYPLQILNVQALKRIGFAVAVE
jgi:hypothetical protein